MHCRGRANRGSNTRSRSSQDQFSRGSAHIVTNARNVNDWARWRERGGRSKTQGSEVSSGSLTQAAAVINGWDDLQNALTSKRIDRWH